MTQVRHRQPSQLQRGERETLKLHADNFSHYGTLESAMTSVDSL